MMAMAAEARKIDARNGGSITKNKITPETNANTLAMIATTMLTVRSWAISFALAWAVVFCTFGIVRAQISVSLGTANLNWQQRFLGILPLVKPDPKDPVVVTVNGTPITEAQINDYAKTEANMINATSTEESKAVFKDATENLISRQLLIDEAKRRKISIPDQQVAARAAEFKVASPSGQEAPGDKTSSTDPQLLEEVRGSMMIEKMLDDDFRAAKVRPTEDQTASYYQQHKDLFIKDPGEVCISHIAVKISQDATDAQKQAAEDKIRKLYKEAQKTKDFAAFAKANSEDTSSAPKGGDLGCFRRGPLPAVVEKEVFSTPVGHLTNIIESNIGYSFIKVTARHGETYSTLEEVKPKIQMVLLDYNEDAVVKSLLKKLAKNAKIDFHKPA